MEKLDQTLDQLAQVEEFFFKVWSGEAVRAACEVGMFTKLVGKKMKAEDLAKECGIVIRKPHQFFDALVCMKVLERDEFDFYYNAPLADKFLNKVNADNYVGSYLTLLTSSHSPFIRAPATLQEVETRDQKGKFYSINDANFFAEAMHGLSVGALIKSPALALWKNAKSFVDMGGSRGHLSAAICRAHPHIKGIVCDLPEVKPAADEFISQQGLGDRLVY